MDDAAAGLPEAEGVLLADGVEEVVDFPVLVIGAGEVLLAADLGLDEVVAMDRAGHGGLAAARGHELEQRHLRRRVLHGHAVRTQVQVALAADDLLRRGLVQVSVDDLLGQRQRTVQALPHHLQVGGHLLVNGLHELGVDSI